MSEFVLKDPDSIYLKFFLLQNYFIICYYQGNKRLKAVDYLSNQTTKGEGQLGEKNLFIHFFGSKVYFRETLKSFHLIPSHSATLGTPK